jgi:glucose-6-phosphate dehydrogenase assembly protein OpcA
LETPVSAAFDPVDIERRVDESLSRSGAALKRSSLCTLVVVHPRALQTTVATRLDRLFGRRPLRVVRLETGYDAPTAVDVSARCLPHRDGDEVCFQEIVFYCGPDSRGREDALWAPLVIRDLPVLLWLDDPAALAARNETAPAVDKILIDLKTITGADAPAALRVLALLAGRFQGTIGTETPILADLAWRALTQARLAIARLFDGPETRPFLSRLTRVEFSISSAVDALLLALWLAARLGWKAGTLQGDELGFTGATGEAKTVRLAGTEDRWFAVSFRTADNITLGLERNSWIDPACGEECLVAEIDLLAPDPVYGEVLAIAARLAGKV